MLPDAAKTMAETRPEGTACDGSTRKHRKSLRQIGCVSARYGLTNYRLTLGTSLRDLDTSAVVVLRSVAMFRASDVTVALAFTRARRWARW